jgi:CHAT domain-containing protein/tetratricopeptide (TPR) repeat protein
MAIYQTTILGGDLMLSIHSARLWSVILACLLFSSIPAQDESQKERAASAVAADEAALRALAEDFYAHYAKKDLDGFLQLWSAGAPELAARRQTMQQLFADHERIEVKGPVIRKMTVEGEKAKLRVEIEMNAIEARTGEPAAGFGKMIRALDGVEEEGAWKVWREAPAEEDLAAALASLKTDDERSAILTAEKELVTERLVREMIRQSSSLNSQGDYPEALARFGLAQNIAEQIGDKAGIASTLTNIGIVHFNQGNYAQALEHCQKGLALFEALGDKAGMSRALNNIGSVHLYQGDYAQALEHYQKSLAMKEALGDKSGVGGALNNIGNVHYRQGNYAQALELYQKSLALKETVRDKDAVGKTLINIGQVHYRQGNYAQALEQFQKSLSLNEAIGNKSGVSSALNGIGLVHFNLGNYAQALEYIQKSLMQDEAMGNKFEVSNALNNIGLVHYKQGNYAQALEYYQKSLALNEALGAKEAVCSVLIDIGHANRLLGNYTQALDFAGRATLLAKQLGYPVEFWRARNEAGQSYRALNQLTSAREALEEAIGAVETLRAQVAGGAQEQQRFFEEKIAPYQTMVELLVAQNQSGAALAYAERAKARVLLDVLRGGRININKAMTSTEQERERGFNDQLVSLNTQISQENPRTQPDPARLNDLKAQLQKARLDYEAFQTGLYAAHPELKAQRGEVETLTPEQARALLPDAHSALLEYVVTKERTYLFALTAGTAIELKVYPLEIKSKELNDRASQFRETLAKGDPGFRRPARELYDLLLKPAAAQLEGRTSLVIVPDGALWEMPFQVLQPDLTRYLIEDCAIAYAPSLTALREMIKLSDGKKDSTGSLTLLAFGNPALGKQTISRVKSTLMDEKLDPLPEAERQVNVMRQIYGAAKSKVYIGAEASEERAKAEAGSYRILHLATHGILNNSSPMYSHLLLSQAEGSANEDGLLEAWEIMKLDLNANLAVLSACETARGRVGAGEGMIGLSWALFVAGCPTSVVSQWKVDSASTTELMLEFHRQLKSQMEPPAAPISAARALREAALKLQRTKEYRHPFYWAGFVVAGKGF